MNEAVLADPVLARVKRELQALYGTRLKRVVLYGSRARGDHGPESDYDILVVLEGPVERWPEQKKLCDLASNIEWEAGGKGAPVALSLKAMTEEQMQQRTGFMHNVRLDGVEL